MAVSGKVLVGNNSNDYGGEQIGFACTIACPMGLWGPTRLWGPMGPWGPWGPWVPMGPHGLVGPYGPGGPMGLWGIQSNRARQTNLFGSVVPRGFFQTMPYIYIYIITA